MNFHIRPPRKALSLTGISSDSVAKLTLYHPHYKEISGIRKCDPFLRPLSQLSLLPFDLPDYIGKFAFYHPHYKEKPGMTKSHDPFILRPSPKLSSPGTFSDCVGKFSIYHLHYKEKLDISNLTRNFACNAELGLVTKKGELPKTFLYLLLGAFQLPSLIISLTLSKMRPPIFDHLAMSKCVPMSKWQFSSILASFSSLADYSSIELTSEASINFSSATQIATQIVEISPNNIALPNKQFQWQISNKSRGLRYFKLGQDILSVLAVKFYTMMAHKFDIKKQHRGRYQIVQKKSN